MCHRCVLALAGLGAVVIAIEAAGSHSASEALTAMVITLSVCLPVTVAAMLWVLAVRVRREHLTYRPDPAIRARRVRAEIVASHAESNAERPDRRTPLALPASPVDPAPGRSGPR